MTNIIDKIKKFLNKLLYFQHRIICVELGENYIQILGVHKNKNNLSIWMQDRINQGISVNFNQEQLQEIIDSLIENYAQFRDYRLLLICPDLKTIYRQNQPENGDSNNSINNQLQTFSEFRIVSNNPAEQNLDSKLYSYAKNSDLIIIENVFKEKELFLAGIFKGNPEWIYSYLFQYPEKFQGVFSFCYQENSNVSDITIENGICTLIQTKNRNTIERDNYECIMNCEGNNNIITDSQNQIVELGFDADFASLYGTALCYFFPQFSLFNYLDSIIQQKIKLDIIWKRVYKYLILGIFSILVINLLLCIPYFIIGHQYKSAINEMQIVENKITKINQLKHDYNELLEQQKQIVNITDQKTNFGKSFYLISQAIPASIWLDEIELEKNENSKDKTTINGNFILINGYAKEETSILSFIENLEKEHVFKNIILEQFDKEMKNNNYANKNKTNGIKFTISLNVTK